MDNFECLFHRLGLICIFFTIAVFPLLMSSVEDEEEWIKIYGTHPNDSGKWPLALRLREDLPQLKLFCAKAHEQWTKTKITTMEAYVNYWPVTFDDLRIKPILAHMIMYVEENEQRRLGEKYIYTFMTKGNRPDCVFYLLEDKPYGYITGLKMLFGDHVCGITGFEKYSSIN